LEDEEGTIVELVGGSRVADDSGEGAGVVAVPAPAVTVLGRAVGDKSVEGFLANDNSLARGSFERDVEEAETESAPSSVFLFFCKLALRSASSSGSVSSRVSFFRFTLVFVVVVIVVVVTGRVSDLSFSFSLSLSVGIVVLDIRIALGFLSWVCWVDAVEGGFDCESLGVGRASAGVEGLVGVSTPSGVDDDLTPFEAEPGCLLTGTCK